MTLQYSKFKKTELGDIPEEWELSEFKDLSIIKGGRRLPLGDKFSKLKTAYPYLRVSDFRNGSIDKTNLQYLTENTYKRIKNYTISKDDVYISIAGTIGLVGLIPQELDGANLTENAAKITNLKNITKEYVAYAFNSYLIQKQIKSHTGQLSQPKLALFRIEKIKIPLPEIKEQQKIASILSNVDQLILKTDQIIKQNQRLRKGLMQTLLTKGIANTKFKKEIVAFSVHEKDIPITWKISKLNQLCKVVRGGSPRPAGDPRYFGGKIPWITVGDLTKNDQMYLYSVDKSLNEEGKIRSRYLEKGTVVLTNSGATLGIPKILNIAGCINDGIAAFLDLKNELLPQYLYYVLFSWIGNFRNINQGMGQPNLNTEIIGNLLFSLPPIDEQRRIVFFILNIDSKLQKEILIHNQLANIKKGLMQRLLTGKIRVKV